MIVRGAWGMPVLLLLAAAAFAAACGSPSGSASKQRSATVAVGASRTMDAATTTTRTPPGRTSTPGPASSVAPVPSRTQRTAIDVTATATEGVLPPIEPTSTGTPPSTPAPPGSLRPIAFSPGQDLTAADLAARPYRSSPITGAFLGARLVIPKIGADAPFYTLTVGPDGQMPGAEDANAIAYYDFSQWPSLGGLPGIGGNVVVAGLWIPPPAGGSVLSRLEDVAVGDRVGIQMQDGSLLSYRIEFNKVTSADGADYQSIVQSTSDESITLITGAFPTLPNGHWANRRIAWGRRVS